MGRMSIKKATFINAAAKYYAVICSFIVNIVLSRILTPAEYGVVAVVTVFITFFTIFSDMGIGTAYIQNKKLDRDDTNNLFSFMCYVGFFLFWIFFGFSYLIAWFYGSVAYIKVGWILGLNLLFTAINVIPYSHLLKEQKFFKVAIIQIISITIAGASAIIFALNGFSYYSIALQSVISVSAYAIIFVIMVRPKFKFLFKFESIKKVFGFSLGQLGFNFINYFSRNADNLVIGKVLGDEALGYYDKSYKTTTYVVTNFSSIIGSSIQPVLSKYQDDTDFVYRKFEKIFSFLFFVGVFISVVLYFNSREVILILYGNQWVASIVPFSFLALSLFAQLSLNITGAFYQTLNRTKLMAIDGLTSAMVLVPLIVAGVFIGDISTVAMLYLVAQAFNFVKTFTVMHIFLFKRKPQWLLKHLGKEIIIGAIVAASLLLLNRFLPIENLFLSLMLKLGVAIIVFVLATIIFNEEFVITDVVSGKISMKFLKMKNKIINKFINLFNRVEYKFSHRTKLSLKFKRRFLDNAINGKLGAVDQKRNVVCSITTIPQRINFIKYPILSMLHQKIRPNLIVVYVDKDKFTNDMIPNEIKEYVDQGLVHFRLVRDVMVHTKYFYAFQEYPNSLILTVDDDCVYSSTLVKKLLKIQSKYPNTVSCSRGHYLLLDKNNMFLPYCNWGWNKQSVAPDMRVVPTGVGGVLYNPKDFKISPCQEELFMKLSAKNDDLWLKAIEIVNNIPSVTLKRLDYHYSYTIEESQDVALNKTNVAMNANDVFWSNLTEHFNLANQFVVAKKKAKTKQ